MSPVTIVGIDLSGPANTGETAVVKFEATEAGIQFTGICQGTDSAIRSTILHEAIERRVIVGIDAPLSYQPGGGDRNRDSELRTLLINAGLRPGSVMAPTMTRMAYLTLRGLALARILRVPMVNILEVHPGATLVLGGAPVEDVREFRSVTPARLRLLSWLEAQGLSGIQPDSPVSSHFVAACAAALAAYRWSKGDNIWLAAAEEPFHPYDFCC